MVISGDLQVRSWDDKQTGQKRTATEIVAYKIDFADSGTRSGGRQRRPRTTTQAPRQQAAPQARATAPAEDPFDEDGPPF